MFQQRAFTTVGRNVVLYLFGVGLAVTGALGLAEAVELPVALSTLLFVAGLTAVLLVHEYLDGPF